MNVFCGGSRLSRLAISLGVALAIQAGTSATARAATIDTQRSAPDSTVPVSLGEAKRIERGVTVEAPAGTAHGTNGKKALQTLRVAYESSFPGWTIAFMPARPKQLGMTYVTKRRVEIYVRPGRSTAATAHDIAHELGHVVDVTYNDDTKRKEYLAIRKLKSTTAWWTCNGCTDLQVGAGDFAESFAWIAAPRYRFYSELGRTIDADMARAISGQILPSGLLLAGSSPGE